MAGMEAVADPTWVVNNSNKIWCSIAGMEVVADPTWVVNNNDNMWINSFIKNL